MSGESQCDVATALFLGYLARGDADLAGRVLEELPHDVCEEAHREYLWGVYWRNRGNFAEAETCLQRAVSETPGHDPARAQLASLLEGQGKFDLALRQYVELAAHCGGSDAAIQGMARTLRVLGRVDAARTVLSPLAAKPNPSASVVFDMGWIELESGNIEEAERRFAVMQFDDATLDKMYTPTRITLGLRGKVVEASRLCDKVAAYDDRRLRIVELSSRLSNNPLDAAARAEIERLQGQSSPFSTKDAFGAPVQNADPHASRPRRLPQSCTRATACLPRSDGGWPRPRVSPPVPAVAGPADRQVQAREHPQRGPHVRRPGKGPLARDAGHIDAVVQEADRNRARPSDARGPATAARGRPRAGPSTPPPGRRGSRRGRSPPSRGSLHDARRARSTSSELARPRPGRGAG